MRDLTSRIKGAIRANRDVPNLEMLSREEMRLASGEKHKKGSVKAILAFDTTDSMGAYRDQLRQDLTYLVDSFDGMLEDYELAFMGVGDHCDGKDYLQINHFSRNIDELKSQIAGIRNTQGGDIPEAFECFFRELNRGYPLAADSSLILITDSVPHNMKGYMGTDFVPSTNFPDNGCPLNVDYQKELGHLKERIGGFYIISCPTYPKIRELQRALVDYDKYIMDLEKIESLPNLVMGMCMSEVGRLNYMMSMMQR